MSGEKADVPQPGPQARDDELLIDFLLGRCDEQAAEQVRSRLAEGGDFATRHDELASTFEALGRYEPPAPPENLTERTLARVSALRRSEALLAGERTRRRAVVPTFSFRELAAVAAVVILAVGVFVPSIRQARKLAQRSACAANAGQIGTAVAHYANAHSDMLPGSPANQGFWLQRPGQQLASNSAGLFLLVRSGYLTGDVFQCPAAGGKSFEFKAGMTDFPSAGAIGYSYQHSLSKPLRREALAQFAAKKVILADENPVFSGGVFHAERVARTASGNHGGEGQNVLRLNMQVAWTPGCRVGVDQDNIFLAQGVDKYVGNEQPASEADTFLLPSFGQ